MEFFIPSAENKEQENRIKQIIIDRTNKYFHEKPSFWYRSITFKKDGRLQEATVGEPTNKIYDVEQEVVIAIISTSGAYVVYTIGRGIEAWPPIMVNSICIQKTEVFAFPGLADAL